ncbi:hypothetical protein CP533_2281 [Ophiocordyceps camponoti-saundersi (nom. inval.)]|nr:hypothetical protein CP533_2281 [Ophiocordyceps camponoti-saundersi (nom. inval.)]
MDPSNSDVSETFLAALKRMYTMQDMRARRMHDVHIRYQLALEEARARHVAQFRENHKRMEARRQYYIAKAASHVQRRKELETKVKDMVDRMGNELDKIEDVMKAGYDGREAEAKKAVEEEKK